MSFYVMDDQIFPFMFSETINNVFLNEGFISIWLDLHNKTLTLNLCKAITWVLFLVSGINKKKYYIKEVILKGFFRISNYHSINIFKPLRYNIKCKNTKGLTEFNVILDIMINDQ